MPDNIYFFKVNNRNSCEICSELPIKTPERCHWRCSGIFIVNFEHILHLFQLFLLSTLSKWMFAGIASIKLCRNSCLEVFCKLGDLKNIGKFTGKPWDDCFCFSWLHKSFIKILRRKYLYCTFWINESFFLRVFNLIKVSHYELVFFYDVCSANYNYKAVSIVWQRQLLFLDKASH